jgi:transcriptional regulator with XRE-family HTH domain
MIPNTSTITPLNELFTRMGHRLHRVRMARNEKLTAVASSIGVSHAVVSQIENGRYKGLSVQLLYRLAEYYGIPIDRIITEQE